MIRKIGIIGIGSLGGFLAHHLSEHNNIRELTLVDFDIVELKNVYHSIYDFEHIGEFKVNALEKIIKKNDIIIHKHSTKYVEGKTQISKCDLLIDCRDYVHDRTKYIDIRVYISGRTLVIDCRKRFKSNKNYQGGYNVELTNNELSRAAYITSETINNIDLPIALKNGVVHKINLDLFDDSLDKCIEQNKNKVDMIYDLDKKTDRLQCIEENIKPILDVNKSSNLPVYINDIENKPIVTFSKGLLKNPQDIINSLSIVLKSYKTKNFLISLKEDNNGKKFIELLEETGAA